MKTSSKYDEFHPYFRTREEFRTDPVPLGAPECYLFTAGVILNKKNNNPFLTKLRDCAQNGEQYQFVGAHINENSDHVPLYQQVGETALTKLDSLNNRAKAQKGENYGDL